MIPGQKNDVFAKEADQSFDGKRQPGAVSQAMASTTGFISRVFTNWFGIVNPHHFLFLALLGIFTAVVTFFTDLVAIYIIDRKLCINNMFNSEI